MKWGWEASCGRGNATFRNYLEPLIVATTKRAFKRLACKVEKKKVEDS
jgi:hypothetical protein